MLELPDESITEYDILFFSLFIITLSVISPSYPSLAVYPGSIYSFPGQIVTLFSPFSDIKERELNFFSLHFC